MKLHKIKKQPAFVEYLTQRGMFVHRYKSSHQQLRKLSKKLQPTLEGVTAYKDGWHIPRQPNLKHKISAAE